MNEDQKAFARNMFRLRVHEADGQAFEDLFVNIMGHYNSHFMPIKPQGQFGDRKNDGYDRTTGTYYQVYAPEDIRKSPSNAISKLEEDFNGLMGHWNSIHAIKRFYFVINDKFQGIFPSLEIKLHEIKNSYSLDDCKAFVPRDLELILFNLPDDVIISIIGHMPQLRPEDYLAVSGFTYFLGAWIVFERLAQEMVAILPNSPRPSLTLAFSRDFYSAIRIYNLLTQDEVAEIERLKIIRNHTVHGNTGYGTITKIDTDGLIKITEKLRARWEEIRYNFSPTI